jgi:GntR family transcriptional repressor for pyruvate dehydrogenase complex
MDGKTSMTKSIITRERLAAHLEEEIASGRLKEGVKLPSERRLSERFGVSRPMIREVLRGLADRDLIEVMPGRGAYVKGFSVSDVVRPMDLFLRRRKVTPRDLVEARKMIECQAAALAAERADERDLRAMEWALKRFDTVAEIIEKTRCDLAFHTSVVRAAHNPVIETMFGSIMSMVAEQMIRSLGDPKVSRAGVPYHQHIYEAIREGDPERASSAVAGHLSVAERLYGADYDQSLTSLARRELERLFGPDAILEDLLAAATAVGEGYPQESDDGGETTNASNGP